MQRPGLSLDQTKELQDLQRTYQKGRVILIQTNLRAKHFFHHILISLIC